MANSKRDPNNIEPFTKKNIREALKKLNDLTALGQHPLSEYLASSESFFEKRGERVREEILRALEYLDLPNQKQVNADTVKLSYDCLRCQYIDKQSIQECCQQLGISEPYFHRLRNQGIERLMDILPFLLPNPKGSDLQQTQVVIQGVYNLNKIDYWESQNIAENAEQSLVIRGTVDDHIFTAQPLDTLSNFIIEWDVVINGRAAAFAVGTEEKYYWLSLHPYEKRIRFQTVDAGKWDDFGKFYFQTEMPDEPHRLTFERYRDHIKIAVNGDRLPIYKRGDFDHLRASIPTELGSYDMLFEGKAIPLKVGIGVGVNKNEMTRVEVTALNVYEVERVIQQDISGEGSDLPS